MYCCSVPYSWTNKSYSVVDTWNFWIFFLLLPVGLTLHKITYKLSRISDIKDMFTRHGKKNLLGFHEHITFWTKITALKRPANKKNCPSIICWVFTTSQDITPFKSRVENSKMHIFSSLLLIFLCAVRIFWFKK